MIRSVISTGEQLLNLKIQNHHIKPLKRLSAVHLATGDPGFNRRSGKLAHDSGKLISFDPGQDLHMYSKNELESVIKICDILFGNHHEIKRIQETLKMSVDDLRDFGPDIVVTTHGEDGSSICTDNEIRYRCYNQRYC